MRDYHFSEDAAWSLPLARAHAYAAASALANPWCALRIAGDGYIAQEAAR